MPGGPMPAVSPEKAAAAPITGLQVLVTSQQAFPVFERCFLEAEREIWASFRIFELGTRLRSDAARAVGDTWFDLIAHTLRRGVCLTMVLADFDPVAATDLHERTWRSMRQFMALAEAVGAERLRVTPALHPARAGVLPRLFGHVMLRRQLAALIDKVNALPGPLRERRIAQLPGLGPYRTADGTRLRRCLHLPQVYPATHHQKLAVFDRKSLYIGGLDLNERRYDTPEHLRPAAQTWQDVQCLVEGGVVEAAQAHLEGFLDATANLAKPAPAAPGFLRTLSSPRAGLGASLSPTTRIKEVEAAHVAAVRRATRLIYLETQFFRDRRLARTLARRARACALLHLILLLPAAPDDVAFSGSHGADARLGEHLQSRCFKTLRAGFGDRMLVVSPARPRSSDSPDRDALEEAQIIYVHSKVSLFDETSAIISSANLNGRSLRWDTEAGIQVTEADHIAEVRRQVMGAWLPQDHVDADTAPDTAFDRWRALAEANAAAEPEYRRGFLLPYDPKPAERFGTPVPGAPDEAV